MLITLLSTLIVLGVLIFVHELGHFMAAKAVDIEVPRFSIGLGPRAFGFVRGETEYVVSWLPLGGYVKMAGMEEMDQIEGGPVQKTHASGAVTADDTGVEVTDKRVAGPRDFESKSLPARTLVISAGVIMNIIFAFLVFAISALVWGVHVSPPARIGQVQEELLPKGAEALAALPRETQITSVGGDNVGNFRDVQVAIAKVKPGPLTFEFSNHAPVTIQLQPGDSVRQSLVDALVPTSATPPVIGEVSKGSAAEKGGLHAGDKIISADNQTMQSWQQLVAVIEKNGGKELPLVVDRKGLQLHVSVTPELKSVRGMSYGRLGIVQGIEGDGGGPRVHPGVVGAVKEGASQTWDIVKLTAGFLKDLVTRKTSARNLGGPIMIGKLSGQVARAGLEPFLAFMALFSVNLAVLNLLPIPVLDGGHLMFLLAEAVRRRPLSLNARMKLSQVGFVIVVAIMVWAVANDVLRVFGI